MAQEVANFNTAINSYQAAVSTTKNVNTTSSNGNNASLYNMPVAVFS